eukprot:6462981-Amphidinium_carterae.4
MQYKRLHRLARVGNGTAWSPEGTSLEPDSSTLEKGSSNGEIWNNDAEIHSITGTSKTKSAKREGKNGDHGGVVFLGFQRPFWGFGCRFLSGDIFGPEFVNFARNFRVSGWTACESRVFHLSVEQATGCRTRVLLIAMPAAQE